VAAVVEDVGVKETILGAAFGNRVTEVAIPVRWVQFVS
jgi:hypothetical protein